MWKNCDKKIELLWGHNYKYNNMSESHSITLIKNANLGSKQNLGYPSHGVWDIQNK